MNYPEKGDRQSDRDEEQFYEAMPATFDRFGSADAELDEDYNDDQLFNGDEDHRLPPDDSRFMAILTLVLVSLVAITLAVLFLRGLDTIRSTMPSKSDSSSSLEL